MNDLFTELFSSGRIVDLILVLMGIEALAIMVYRRQTGRGPRRGTLAANLFAGAWLLAALRAALLGAAWPWIAGALTAAFAAHLWDLRQRWG